MKVYSIQWRYHFTNAPADYARQVLRALGVERHFDGIFDLHFSGLEGKSSPAVYEKVLAAFGHPSGACWFVDDSALNLIPARALSCHTVWVTQDSAAHPVYVEFVIRDLAELQGIAQSTSQAEETQA